MTMDRLYLSLATSHRDIDETAGVCYSLLGSALWCLLLLLWLNLCQIVSVYFPSKQNNDPVSVQQRRFVSIWT